MLNKIKWRPSETDPGPCIRCLGRVRWSSREALWSKEYSVGECKFREPDLADGVSMHGCLALLIKRVDDKCCGQRSFVSFGPAPVQDPRASNTSHTHAAESVLDQQTLGFNPRRPYMRSVVHFETLRSAHPCSGAQIPPLSLPNVICQAQRPRSQLRLSSTLFLA